MIDDDKSDMSLVGHLGELRLRLIISLAAILVCTLVTMPFSGSVLKVLIRPVQALKSDPEHPNALRILVEPSGAMRLANPGDLLKPGALTARRTEWVYVPTGSDGTTATLSVGESNNLRYDSPLDPFMIPFKIALVMGLLLSLPVILLQAWKFIQPGLKPAEEKVIKPLLVGAIIMFPMGAAFAYFMVRLLLVVMQSYTIPGIELLYGAGDYLSLLTTMMIVFGTIFEMPLAIAIAARIGIVTPRMLTQYRRHAYVGLAAAAMILTPADGFTMIAALVPMIFLYELSVMLCRPIGLMREREAAARQAPPDDGAKASQP